MFLGLADLALSLEGQRSESGAWQHAVTSIAIRLRNWRCRGRRRELHPKPGLRKSLSKMWLRQGIRWPAGNGTGR